MDEDPQAYVLLISIVGAFRDHPDVAQRTHFLMEDLERSLAAHFPDFLPARWPVTITVSEIRDDYIKNHNKKRDK